MTGIAFNVGSMVGCALAIVLKTIDKKKEELNIISFNNFLFILPFDIEENEQTNKK
jgi:hypothetical protein